MKPKALLSPLLLCAFASLHASTLYWNNGTADTNWTDAGNWTTDAAGSSVAGASPTSADEVVFNASPLNSAINMRVNAAGIGFQSITINNSDSTLIKGG